MSGLIEVRNLDVVIGDTTVLERISFEVPEGKIFGLIGPNGGGKTTLIKTIVGLIRPRAGSVRVDGFPVPGPPASRPGYVPQRSLHDPRFPAIAFDVVMMGRYGRIGIGRRPSPRDREIAAEAIVRVGLKSVEDRPIGRLSGGQQQRIFIARARLGAPRPDPRRADRRRRSRRRRGLLPAAAPLARHARLTVLLATHDADAIRAIVDEVGFLNRTLRFRGRPAEVLGADELRSLYGAPPSGGPPEQSS
jgi:ABC-type Mn2+/Zn2+ transport system ATPase subunit